MGRGWVDGNGKKTLRQKPEILYLRINLCMSKHMRTRAQKIWWEENKTNFLILAISNGGGKQMSVLKKKNKTKQKNQKMPEPTLNVLPKELKKTQTKPRK